KNAHAIGRFPENDYVNYFIGKDRSKWVSRATVSKQVDILNADDGIDYNFYTVNGNLKYDVRLHAGANPANLYIDYEGVQKLSLVNGDLHIQLSNGEVIEKAPLAFQVNEQGQRVIVPVVFSIKENRVYFQLGTYDPGKELIIDPTLIFSSYTGATADNWGYTATYDNAGNLFSGSIVFGSGYPTTAGAYLTSFSGLSTHAAISKFSATGTSLIYSTYLGGNHTDAPHSLIVDASDNLIVMGTTSSTDFPTSATAYDPFFNAGFSVTVNSISYLNGSDIFITKFDNTGSSLLASTLVGGSHNDGLNIDGTLSFNYGDESRGEVSVDLAGNIYVATSTLSTDFPTTFGSLATISPGAQEGCAFKMDANLSTLIWSTYIGGSNADGAYSIKPGTNGRVYITGGTRSPTFPVTPGTLITTAPGGTADGFIMALDATNGSGIASSFLGTGSYDQGYIVEINPDNEIFVFGQTKGAYTVTAGVYSNTNGRQFIHKLNPDLTSTIFSTVFGSGGTTVNISPTALLVDNCQNIYVSGWGGAVNIEGTTTGLPVTGDAYDAATDGSDFYFLVLKKDATALLYGSFFGAGSLAEHVDGGTSRFDKTGTIYQAVCAGCGSSDAFPTTPGAWSNVNGSTNCNLGAIKMEFIYSGVEAIADASPNVIACDPPFNVNFSGAATAVDHIWDFDDGSTSTLMSPMHTFTDTGTYNIMYIAIDSSSCNIADTAYLSVIILESEDFSAVIDVPPYDPCIGGPLTIDMQFTGTGADYISWDMGDGTIYTGDTSISHTYTVTGTYIVEMFAYDSTCGLSGTVTDTIFYNSNSLEVNADASPNVFACDPPYIVTFSNGGSTAVDHFWDFGDGITSTLGNPSHTFADTGTFIVMYIGIDSSSCNISDTSFLTVQIVEPEVFSAVIDIPPYDPCSGGPLVVDLNFTGSGADYISWDMGDGTTYTNDFNVSHTYTANGIYIIEMYAYDSVCGLSGTVTDTVVFQPTFVNVVADASPDGFSCDPPYTVTFSSGGSTAPIHYWNFDDGVGTSSLANPTYTFTTTGVFDIMYVAIDSTTCNIADTSYAQVIILEPEQFNAAFSFTPPPPCKDTMSVLLEFTGTGADSLTWDMGDGTVFINQPFVSYYYVTPGLYTVTLTAYDFVCSHVESFTATFEKGENVFNAPLIVPNIFTPNGDGINDEFYVGYAGLPSSTSMQDMEVYEFKIYNRWGNLVFDNGGSATSWDGKIDGKPANEGVYFYTVRYKRVCGDEEVIETHGHVTIVN
ncbi:MAG TPA: PKD domain-containing protein, partial [Flavobacteriales bacterium]|nr:PKD domain-containing protein [Flavobacteriales bacterium]